MRSYNKGKDNPRFGMRHTKETIEKMRLVKLGEKNPMWKTGKLTRNGLHVRLRKIIPKTDKCAICKKETIELDLANISQEYKQDDFTDWQWLCRRCHVLSDGRMNNLKQFQGELT